MSGELFPAPARSLAEFLGDLEEALRDDFQEEWTSHPARKQKLDGFELSRFVVEWAEQMNYLHPGLLVSLRESLRHGARPVGFARSIALKSKGLAPG